MIGVVPMAGQAKRLGGLPHSKEIYPLPVINKQSAPKVVCEHVLEKMFRAGIDRVYITLRQGKWDIPDYLGDGTKLGMHLAYLMMGLPHGTPYSIDQAFPFIRDQIVALGFPDMIFPNEDIFTSLLTYLDSNDVDVVLGLFPADRPEKTDMVELIDDKIVKKIHIKPDHTRLSYCWGIAVWTSAFTQYLHDYLLEHQSDAANLPELYVGDIVQAGMESGLRVHGIPVSKQSYLDIGTPEDLDKIEYYLHQCKSGD